MLVRLGIVHRPMLVQVPEPLGVYCYASHIGRQSSENPCGLLFVFPPTDLSGSDCLFRWGIAGLVGRRPKHQTRVWNSRLNTRGGNSYVIMPMSPPV